MNAAFGPGQVSEVKVWNRALSGSEICHPVSGLPHHSRFRLSWFQLKDAVYGAVQAVQAEEPWMP